MNIIKETEENFANFIGVKHAIMVNSGTSALHTALLACDIGPEDEVIVPAYTYPATANMVLACGATPVFCDINPKTYLMDLKKLNDLVTNDTSAVIFVNLFGKEDESEEFQEVLDELAYLGIKVIIDSAQLCKPGINYGDIQCFSFYKTKNFSCFEGGAITTEDDYLAKRARIFMNQGEDGKYNTVFLGYNYRMTDLQATMLNHQIMYHSVGGISEIGRWSPEDGHYPMTVYQQPLYERLGYLQTYKGTCPVAEKLAKKVREKYWK